MKKRKHTYQTAASIVAGVALASALVLSTAGSLDADAATRVENLEPTRSVKVDKSKFFHLAPILDVTLAPDGKALLLQLAFKSPATYSIILDGQECGRGEVNESGAAKRLERIPFDLRESEWLLKVDYTLRGVENLHSDETLDGCLIRLLKVTWQNGKAQIEVIKLDDTAAIVKHPETEPVTETKEEDIFANYNANLQNSAKAKEVAKAWGNNMATLIKPGRRSGVVIDGKDEYAKGKVHADGLGSVVVDKNARVVGPIINKTEQKSSVVINRTGASSVNVGSLAKDTGTINASVNTIGASSIVASRATSSIEVGSLSNTNSSTMNVGTIHIHENDEVVRPLSTDREQYAELPASPVRLTLEHPVSTFSIDVDTGAYSNIRRFLNSNRLPPRDAVRIEELVNYFDYEYPLSSNGTPFSVSTEIFDSPFKKEAKILKIALRADDRKTSELPPANLVFLVDVSGSMYADNKLPLVKQTLYILTGQLRPQDKVAIVTYASGEKLALPSTSGGNKAEILRVIDSLQAGGATAGEQAIQMAYREAEKSYIKDGINRIILATDGDFNVGISDRNALTSMVAEKRKSGISLSALGYGTDNYNEAMM